MTDNQFSLLYIEDNPGDVFLIKEYLDFSSISNYQMEVAESLKEAKAKIIKSEFDVVLVDLNLPDSNHIETLKTLLPLLESTAIIVVTGVEDELTGKIAVEEGAQDYLVKNNINPEILIRTIQHSMARKFDQNKLKHLNKMLKAIRTINKLTNNLNNEADLIQKTCDALRASNNSYAVWVVLMNAKHEVKHTASSGFNGKIELFFNKIRNTEYTDCIKKAIKSKAYHINYSGKNCNGCPIPDIHNQGTEITIKLKYKNYFYGLMGIFLPEDYSFFDEEIELFFEIVEDLSFGLHSIYLQKTGVELKKKLDKKELDYEFITSNSIDCLWQLDTDLNYSFISPSLEQIIGAKPIDWIGNPFLKYIDDKEKEAIAVDCKNLITTKNNQEVKAFETTLHYNNSITPVEIVVKCLLNDHNEVIGLQGAIRNISERILHNSVVRQMNKQLKKQNQDYLKVNEKLKDSISEIKKINTELEIRDKKLSYLFKAAQVVLEFDTFKPTAEKIFNFCREFTNATSGYVALLAKNKKENEVLFLDSGNLKCTVDQDIPMPVRGLQKIAYDARKPVFDNNFFESEWNKLLPKGHVKLRNVIFAPLIIKNKTVGLIGLANKQGGFNQNDVDFLAPISEICSIALHNSRVTENLIKAKKKAEESDKLKSAFLSNVSHEIRTPLNAVVGFSALFQKEDLSKEDRETYINFINSNGQSLVNIIDDILDISKIESNQLILKKGKFNLKSALDEIYMYFSPIVELNKNKNIQFIFDVDDKIDETLYLNSDKTRLKQIIVNLINNALKYTHQGYVKLTCKINNNRVFIEVHDSGVGISKKNQSKIFDRFVQFNKKFVSRNHGTGLGLSISKGIVELLGGSISVESELGKGSIFRFNIPFESDENLPFQEKVLVNTNMEWKNKRILIVDDEESSYVLTKRILGDTHASFEWARDGEEAVKMVKSNDYSLILMDIKMPKMDGISATRIIKKAKPNIPIVIQTAFAMDKEKDLALQAGCTEYIIKPILFDSFVKKMQGIGI